MSEAPHLRRSSRLSDILWIAGTIAVALVMLTFIPDRALTTTDTAFIATLGMIGLWRWSWGGFHMLRAWLYTRVLFPMLRARAEAEASAPRHVAVICLSWKIGDAMNAAVYGNIFRDILDYGATGTVIASVSSDHDIALIRHVHGMEDPRGRIRLSFTMQDGTGKRSAMADALARLRELGVPPDCVGVLMDGDTLVQPGTLRATAPIMLHQPKVGALTLDNTPIVSGTTLAREWYRLRMGQRHVYMSSMAVSGRVLVLTGRWSMFRSQILTDPNFAATLLEDVLYHPRLGRIVMLTGDDKSTWRWVVEQGWQVTYVPDRVIYCLESLPGKGFFLDTIGLQKRWFGNMTRGGAKALKLGPRRLGWFTWFALMDQKVSMWTALSGLTFFGLAALLHDPAFLAIFVLWILITRTIHSGLVGLVSGRWHPSFPWLTYYGQLGGSFIKIYTLFNPNVQKWTRQNTGSSAAAMPRWDSRVLMFTAIVVFASVITILTSVASDTMRFQIHQQDLVSELTR